MAASVVRNVGVVSSKTFEPTTWEMDPSFKSSLLAGGVGEGVVKVLTEQKVFLYVSFMQ